MKSNTATTKPSISGKTLSNFVAKLTPAPNGKCLLFTGARTKGGTGYGLFHNGERMEYAHRFAYQLWNETTIPADMYCLHRCDTPNCVSKKCLFIGTAAENSRDMVKKGRSTKGAKKPQKRFTAKEKAHIVALSIAGTTQYAIAKLYERAESTISYVLRKHKPAPKPLSPVAAAVAEFPADTKQTTKRLAKCYVSLGEQLTRARQRSEVAA